MLRLFSEKTVRIMKMILSILSIITLCVGCVFLFFVSEIGIAEKQYFYDSIDGMRYDWVTIAVPYLQAAFGRGEVFCILSIAFTLCASFFTVVGTYFSVYRSDKTLLGNIVDVVAILFFGAAIPMIFISFGESKYVSGGNEWAILVSGILVSCSCLFVLCKIGLSVLTVLVNMLFKQ